MFNWLLARRLHSILEWQLHAKHSRYRWVSTIVTEERDDLMIVKADPPTIGAQVETSPSSLAGPWKAGYALALHTVKSEFLGYNEQGHAKYDTTRSAVGEALYQLKYQGQANLATKLAKAAADFVAAKGFPVELIVALPPSKKRSVQPVALIAKEVADRLKVPFDARGLRKVKDTPELKSLTDLKEREEALKGAYAPSESVKGKTVLLFDDLYRSGASMQEAARTLVEVGGAKTVYVLALTRTRTNR